MSNEYGSLASSSIYDIVAFTYNPRMLPKYPNFGNNIKSFIPNSTIL
jgi:hypothetical protein